MDVRRRPLVDWSCLLIAGCMEKGWANLIVVSHRNCWLATGMVIASLVSVVKWQPGQMYGLHIVLTSLRSFEKFSLSSLTLSSSLSTAWAESSRSHSILPQQTANQLHLLPQSRGARTDELSGPCWENLQHVGLTRFAECNYSTSARACMCVCPSQQQPIWP